jgi:hypothetical protein
METPANDRWLRRGGAGYERGGPRELLPWADPYIAGLIRRLEAGFDEDAEQNSSDPYAPDEMPSANEWHDDGWEEDAFMPRPFVAPRIHSYPPVIGGFPLLDAELDGDGHD